MRGVAGAQCAHMAAGGGRWCWEGLALTPSLLQPPLLAPGHHAAGGGTLDGPMLSKAEFVERVRQSNQACHDGDFQRAIALYGEALAVDPQNCILYSNRSAAYAKTQQYDLALEDAAQARLLNPKWPKVRQPLGVAPAPPQPLGGVLSARKACVGLWELRGAKSVEGVVPPWQAGALPTRLPGRALPRCLWRTEGVKSHLQALPPPPQGAPAPGICSTTDATPQLPLRRWGSSLSHHGSGSLI